MSAYVPVLVALLMMLSAAGGYLVKRRIERRGTIDEATSIRAVVELRKLLDDAGLSFEEAKVLRDRLFTGRDVLTPEMAKVIAERQNPEDMVPDDTVDFADTTFGMKMGMANRLQDLEGQIEYALAELMHTASETRQEAFRQSHAAWLDYQVKEGEVAGLLWEGGTGAPLLGLARQVELSERRLSELRQMKADEALM